MTNEVKALYHREEQNFKAQNEFYGPVLKLADSVIAEDKDLAIALRTMPEFESYHLKTGDGLNQLRNHRVTVINHAAERLDSAQGPNDYLLAAQLALYGAYYSVEVVPPTLSPEHRNDFASKRAGFLPKGVLVGGKNTDQRDNDLKTGYASGPFANANVPEGGANKIILEALEKLWESDSGKAEQLHGAIVAYMPTPLFNEKESSLQTGALSLRDKLTPQVASNVPKGQLTLS